jgi:hypothetical protein
MPVLPDAVLAPDTLTNRPAAGSPGRLFYATDTQLLYRDTGTGWDTLTMGGGTPAAHDHTGTGDGGVLTNDKHDGYSEYAQIATPSSPAANSIRVYAKDKSGTATLYYKDEAGTEFELPTIVTGGGGAGSGAPADAHYVTTQAEAGLSAEVLLSAVVGRGTTASKPAAGTAGRLYFDTDLGKLQRDSGSAWQDVESTTTSGAPTDAHYVTTQAESGLSAEQVLSDVIGYGTTASRPSAAIAGRLYYNTSTGRLQRDNGSGWDDAEAASSGTVTVREIDGTPSMTASVIEVTNAKLTDEGSGVARLDLGGGAAGSSITAGTFASRPAAGTSGDLYMPTDASIISEDTGSAWRNFGPIHLLTKPPTVASGTWLNQGSATITEEKELLHLFLPKESVLNIRGMHWAAPATPYTITALISFNPIVVSQMMFGVLWRQSSDGKVITAHLETAVSSLLLNVYKWSSPTVFSASYVGLNWWQHRVWVKLEDDGTNRKVHISTDGLYFTQIHTVGRTDFMTANQVGLFGIANTASGWDMHGTLLSWVAA